MQGSMQQSDYSTKKIDQEIKIFNLTFYLRLWPDIRIPKFTNSVTQFTIGHGTRNYCVHI